MSAYISYDLEEKCINDHFIQSEIIDTKTIITHDGYDAYGPESDLFDFYILYQKNKEIFLNNYHRENWFDGVLEEYYLCNTLNISNKLKEKGFLMHDIFRYCKNLLTKNFIEDISSKIMDNYEVYNPLKIRFNRFNENTHQYQINNEVKIYF